MEMLGYQGADKRPDMPTPEPERKFQWHIAMKRSQRKALDHQHPISALQEQLEQVKSKVRAKVEHPFRVIKRQFGHVKVRYRGLSVAIYTQTTDVEHEVNGLLTYDRAVEKMTLARLRAVNQAVLEAGKQVATTGE